LFGITGDLLERSSGQRSLRAAEKRRKKNMIEKKRENIRQKEIRNRRSRRCQAKLWNFFHGTTKFF
jgi:hypothetical protein